MRKTLSVAIITRNEEANLERTLGSVSWADEIVVVDSGSSDRTEEIARGFGCRFFCEEWKGFAAQKNSALEKCACDWILSLDADESLSDELATEIRELLKGDPPLDGYALCRRNLFLGRWMRFGGFYPDPKLRLFRRGAAGFEARPVHETLQFVGNAVTGPKAGRLKGDMVHNAYPTLQAYIAHMDRYSTLGAAPAQRRLLRWGFAVNVVLNPVATFVYSYFFRLGFLDGREGLLLHAYHSVYVSWKYAKAWEQGRRR
jgi:glycosyltransferase involved in cell wall biosynthesis